MAGSAAMSASTNMEMRLRRRPPSRAPAKALARALRVRQGGERRKTLLAAGGHVATGTSLGASRGLLDRVGLPPRAAGAALFALAMAPELVIVPALGAAPPPRKWTRADAAVSVLHHAVFAAATDTAYVRLRRRD
jgi:hypothetical protein